MMKQQSPKFTRVFDFDENHEVRVHWVARNGKTVEVSSEGYKRSVSCLNSSDSLIAAIKADDFVTVDKTRAEG